MSINSYAINDVEINGIEFDFVEPWPEDNSYYLELDNGVKILVPLVWVTIRKTHSNGIVEVGTTCKIPPGIITKLSNYIDSSARLYRIFQGAEVDVIIGSVSSNTGGQESLIKLRSIEGIETTTLVIQDVSYVRVFGNSKTIRMKVNDTIPVGATIRTSTDIVLARHVVTHIHNENSFTEVSE